MDDDPKHPPTLNYRPPQYEPRLDFRDFSSAAVMAVIGFIAGVVGLALVGLVVSILAMPVPVMPYTPPSRIVVVLTAGTFWVLFVVCLAFGVGVFRSVPRAWAVIGFLLGIGLTALLEGICFARQ